MKTSKGINDKGIPGTKLADGAVTGDKLAAGAVTWSRIADDSVSAEKLHNLYPFIVFKVIQVGYSLNGNSNKEVALNPPSVPGLTAIGLIAVAPGSTNVEIIAWDKDKVHIGSKVNYDINSKITATVIYARL